MIIKVVNDKGEDKHLLEAAAVEYRLGKTKLMMDVFYTVVTAQRVDVVSESVARVEKAVGKTIRLNHGDTVYVMNNDGKTIDTKHIDLPENEWVCQTCGHRNLPSEVTCTGPYTAHRICRICGYVKE